MLIRLRIQNIVLVDLADLLFDKGLNIITGETGSGKSALLSAIQLIAGQRADTHLIGKKGDLGIVEAEISSSALPPEIDAPSAKEPLLIRRELHRSGKSRCFVSDHLVSLSTLRQIVGSSIEFVDQSSSQVLCHPEEQRNMLDTFADALQEAKQLASSYAKQVEVEKKIGDLIKASETSDRDLAWAEEDLQQINQVNWNEEEEDKLTQEHYRLTHAQELLGKIETASNCLSENGIKKAASLLEAGSRIDPRLAAFVAQLKNASCEIEEVQRSLHAFFGHWEVDPKRLAMIEERLASFEQIKRRFGKTYALVQEKKGELQKRIDELSSLDQQKNFLQKSLALIKEENYLLANQISLKRRNASSVFSSLILSELRKLNMPQAQFQIAIEKAPMASHGCDHIRFLFSANAGHPPIALEDCASGGELSRLLLSIKTILADKEKSLCLVFDEIDSNVGGHTAAILGEKLKTIAHNKQVICVTHFVQVAKCASFHFAVAKEDAQGKTTTTISRLTDSEKKEEYLRMTGGLQS